MIWNGPKTIPISTYLNFILLWEPLTRFSLPTRWAIWQHATNMTLRYTAIYFSTIKYIHLITTRDGTIPIIFSDMEILKVSQYAKCSLKNLFFFWLNLSKKFIFQIQVQSFVKGSYIQSSRCFFLNWYQTSVVSSYKLLIMCTCAGNIKILFLKWLNVKLLFW